MAPMSRFALVAVLAVSAAAPAAEWPMHRGNPERSGYTPQNLPEKLSLAWTYHPRHPPDPAWPRDERMMFDRANDVAVAGGLVILGSSADGRVTALDAATGEPRWTYFTDAPVRLAPAVWKDRVFVASDDGCLYCLAAADGSLLERWRSGPSDEMILGNGRMVSRWPGAAGRSFATAWSISPPASGSRTAYGFRPSTPSRAACCGPTTRRAASTCRSRTAGRTPRAASRPKARWSPPRTELLVPTGRAVPAAFLRQNGKFLYYHSAGQRPHRRNADRGDRRAVLQRRQRLSPGKRRLGGEARSRLDCRARRAAWCTRASANCDCLKLVEKTAPDRKGVPTKSWSHETAWSLSGVDGSAAAIVAGESIFVGGETAVTAVDLNSRRLSGRPKWTALPTVWRLRAAGCT
jgi:hypothetical protein